MSGKANNMTSRERVIASLNFQPVDRVPLDIGSSPVTGAHVSIVSKLQEAYGLVDPGTPVKVCEPYQMLGEIPDVLMDTLEIDVIGVPAPVNMFGFRNENWKPWTTFDGTNVLVPEMFNIDPEPDGSILMYPEGDKSVPASGKMPKGGFYFDSIVRQEPIVESKLDPNDNLEDFGVIPDENLKWYEQWTTKLYDQTDKALLMVLPGAAFGDIALVPGPWVKHPKGIRDIEEWYISTAIRKDYVKAVFAGQADICIENMKKIYQAVGDRVQVMMLDGTDHASQETLFCSPDGYRELYLPYAKKVNDWIHANTQWKTFKHCCGACFPLIECYIEAGYDIINPVQTSAKGMSPNDLVETYGGKITFWGGGVCTQTTLPFGSPQEVYDQVKERVEVFNRKSGFVFDTVHNIQCGVPTENLLAMFEALGREVPQSYKVHSS